MRPGAAPAATDVEKLLASGAVHTKSTVQPHTITHTHTITHIHMHQRTGTEGAAHRGSSGERHGSRTDDQYADNLCTPGGCRAAWRRRAHGIDCPLTRMRSGTRADACGPACWAYGRTRRRYSTIASRSINMKYVCRFSLNIGDGAYKCARVWATMSTRDGAPALGSAARAASSRARRSDSLECDHHVQSSGLWFAD